MSMDKPARSGLLTLLLSVSLALQGAGCGAVTVTPTVGYWSVAAGRKDPAQ